MSRNNRRQEQEPGLGALARAVIVAHPRQSVATFMGFAAACAIMSNALFLQSGQHPAPLFSGKTKTVTITPDAVTLPRPRAVDMTPPAPVPVVAPSPSVAPPQAVAPRSRADIITDLQRDLSRKGFYDGAVDGVWGSRTDNALRDFLQTAGVRMSAEANEDVLRVVVQSSVVKGPRRSDTQRPYR